jgi:hypothetical protein
MHRGETTMTKANVLAIAVLGFTCLSNAGPANAQANPKFDKCVAEAKGKGLIVDQAVSGGRGGGQNRANSNLAAERKAFMAECMNRK